MTAIQLYKFIKENELECHRCDDNDITIFINDFMVEELRDGIHRLYMMLVIIASELFYILLWR
jgi:hypothetical protein